jgi:Domain of unknown function (DUF5710)/UvrD-like helicase C-terminal domain/AAA domain
MAAKSFRIWLYNESLTKEESRKMSFLFDEGVSNTRIDLRVPFEQKDQAKSAGARWDNAKKVWFIPPGVETSHFRQWMGNTPAASAAPMQARQQSAVLTTQRVDLNVPFEQKDLARNAGARWDGIKKVWFAPPGIPIQGISQWINQRAQNPVQTPQPNQQAQLQPNQAPGAPFICGTAVEGNEFGIPAGQRLVARKDVDNTWEVWDQHIRGRDKLTDADIKATITANRDKDGKPEKTQFPMNFLRPKKEKKDSNMLDASQMSDEQAKIDADFGVMMESPGEQHMTIPALAGTGKTTSLRHLAWKYGRPGQKWLYLVFNTKNKEEATKKFPSFVQVESTNSFLGRMLRSQENMGSFPQTNLMATLDRKEGEGGKKGGNQKLEKATVLADSPQFVSVMNSLGIPDPKNLQVKLSSNTTSRILFKLRNHFQRQVLKLTGLAKSYSLDPRVEHDAMAGLDLLIEDYKTQVDVNMTDIKDDLMRLAKDSPYEYQRVMGDLNNIFGGDFYKKSFSKDVKSAAFWMLQQTLPRASQHMYRHSDGKDYNLADFRDFNDDLWYPAIHPNEIHWPHYDIVLADEVQDFNDNQRIMLDELAKAGAKIVAVGDVNQCHPAGTLIALTGGKKVPIEAIKEGDLLVTYNSKKSYFPGTNSQGRRVEEIATRRYSGDMITITTESNWVDCTPNHKCLVRFDGTDKYCLYLMVKGESARVGICKLNYFNGFGLTIRSTQEEADKSWVLGICDNWNDARIAEYVTSIKYGLPQIIFKNTGQKTPSQDFINEVYKKVENNLHLAKKCLEDHGRLWEYPLWERGEKERFGSLKQNYIGSTKSFITQACNLMTGVMKVKCFDGTDKGGKWETITVSRRTVDCDVYSLRVEPTEDGKRLYIANGIVTHNSIYRFRGADSSAFQGLRSDLSKRSANPDIDKPLTKNFRSRPAIIDFSNKNTHVKDLKVGKQFDDGYAGTVTDGSHEYDDAFNQLKWEQNKFGFHKETAFISRTNEPLVHAALKLLTAGMPFVILGKDISGSLRNQIRSTKKDASLRDDDPVGYLAEALSKHVESEVKVFGGERTKDAYLSELNETTEALLSAIGQYKSEQNANEKRPGHDPYADSGDNVGDIRGFEEWIYQRLGGLNVEENSKDAAAYQKKMEEQNPVVLTTAHKSKGLEFERVYMLRADQFPHPKSKDSPKDLHQEENSKYVSYTRPKNDFHILKLDGQPGYKPPKPEPNGY